MSLGLLRAPLDPPSGVGSARVVLGASEPTAIGRLVIPVGVTPVDLVVKAGALAHVFEEVLKGIPARADRDATGAVLGVGAVANVTAPGPHGAPSVIRRRLGPAVPVRRRPLTRVRSQPGTHLLGVVLALHRVRGAGVVAADVLTYAVSSLIHGGVLATSAGAELRHQRRPVLLMPLRFGDCPLGLFGVMAAFDCHAIKSSPPKGNQRSSSSERM